MNINELRKLAGLPLKKIEKEVKSLTEGYMGLKHWADSDLAADLTYPTVKAVIDALKKGLKERGNHHNTPGYVNVALIMVDLARSDLFGSHATDEYEHFAKQVLEILEQHASEWGSMEDKSQTREYKALTAKVARIAGQPLKEDAEHQLSLPMPDWSKLDEMIDEIIHNGKFKVDFKDADGPAVREAMRAIYRSAYKAGQDWAKETSKK